MEKWVSTSDKFKSDNFFGFELVLHEDPVGDSTIGTDRVEVVVL